MHPPGSKIHGSLLLSRRAACGPIGLREFMLRLQLLHSVSRGWNASEGVDATDAWGQICALTAGFTPTIATPSMTRAG